MIKGGYVITFRRVHTVRTVGSKHAQCDVLIMRYRNGCSLIIGGWPARNPYAASVPALFVN